jgi:integrase
MSVRLTVKVLQALEVGQKARDSEARGLWAERGARGVSWKWQDVLREGPRTGEARKPVTIRVTLGTWPELPLEQARARALALRAEVKAGRDPRKLSAPTPHSTTLADLWRRYVEGMRLRGCAPTSIAGVEARMANHLAATLGPLPLSQLTRAAVQEEHTRLTAVAGPVGANATLKSLRAAWAWAQRSTDLELGANPCAAVAWHAEIPRTERLRLPQPGMWVAKVRELPSPLRALMHEWQLFTGVRPGMAARLRREWLLLDQRCVRYPREAMKRRRPFDLPLSGYALELLRRALELSDQLYPGSPWVFASRSQDSSRVIATVDWSERALPGQTGHVVRHMFSNAAARARVTGADRRLLLAQTVTGIEGLYLNEPSLFEHLLTETERVTELLLREISLQAPRAAPFRVA